MTRSPQICAFSLPCCLCRVLLRDKPAGCETKASRGTAPHVFSIAGVDLSPVNTTQFGRFTVCFCQIWPEPLCLQPNLKEHLVLFRFKNSAQIMRQQERLALSLQAADVRH